MTLIISGNYLNKRTLYLITLRRERNPPMKQISILIIALFLTLTTTIPQATSHIQPTTPANAITIPSSLLNENWTLRQKITASDASGDSLFGDAVDSDHDTAIIGSSWDNENGLNSGSAYIFEHTNTTTWTQQTKLLAPDGEAMDWYGYAVAIDKDTALVGAPQYYDNKTGAVYVYTRNGPTWTLQTQLHPTNGTPYQHFGYSLDLDGDTALIGAPGQDQGAAYVFTRKNDNWTQQARLQPDDFHAIHFGGDVALYNNTAVIGAYSDNESGANAGAAYVFTRTNNIWTKQQKIMASDTDAGDDFGTAVSLSDDTLLVGAQGAQTNGYWSGAAYVFTRTNGAWQQQTKLTANDTEANDYFGMDLSLDRDTALIGSVHDAGPGFRSGAAYVFTRPNGTTWAQQVELLAPDTAAEDQFGGAVSLDINTAFIGAKGNDHNKGAVYVFTRPPVLNLTITGGLDITVTIQNTGHTDISDVEWQIHIAGGFFKRINKTMMGTIAIPAGESRSVGTGLLFGLGPITITASADDVTIQKTGIQLLVCTLLKDTK